MNSYILSGLVVLAILTTLAYFYGAKKNRWLAFRLSEDIEAALKPKTTQYVNIGGNIGYNFVYALREPFSSAKGTITLSPRHSLLYLPLSLLFGFRDRYFLNLFTKKAIRGEGHIVAASRLKSARIVGVDEMERREKTKEGIPFVLLWRGADLSAELSALLEAIPEVTALRHFCAYPETGTFFLHGTPRGNVLGGNLAAVMGGVHRFFEGEGK